jgi:hypothetical protein
MQGPDIVRLLDEAKKITGSDYKTAKLIKTTRQRISNWRMGECTMPPADVALVADVAGLDAVAWTARAVAQAHEGTEKGDALREALKKAWLATGVAIVSGSTHAAEQFTQLIRCIDRSPDRATFPMLRGGDRRLVDRGSDRRMMQ